MSTSDHFDQRVRIPIDINYKIRHSIINETYDELNPFTATNVNHTAIQVVTKTFQSKSLSTKQYNWYTTTTQNINSQ